MTFTAYDIPIEIDLKNMINNIAKCLAISQHIIAKSYSKY